MRKPHAVLLLLTLGVPLSAALGACSAGEDSSTGSTGTGGVGAASGGLGGAPNSGGFSNTGGLGVPSGGATASGGMGTGGVVLVGGAPNVGGSGGASSGGTTVTGGAGSGTGGAGVGGSGGFGGAGTGGAGSGGVGLGGASSGGATSGGAGSGAAGLGDAGAGMAGSGDAGSGAVTESYALPPPHECSNQFAVEGCVAGDSSSPCGGECSNDNGPTSKNACESGKPGVPVQFACPRHMLFSTEMNRAVVDDGYEGAFHYGIVGHDPDPSNLDAGLPNSCCQCYQLVFDVPTYLTASTLTPPPPLVVQSANTAASGPTGFDVFMGAGGLGAFNACNADLGLASSQGYSMYTGYPRIGQAFSGGVKPGPDSVNCADEHNNLSDALISDPSCQERIESACNEITAADPALQEDTRQSCIQSNQADTYYHENWNVYAKRVACPTHLMEVTGCKLPPEPGLPQPDPSVQTAAQAAAAGFRSGYHTTTMQDCCMPTCAWSNNVQVETVDGYNSFYSCLEDGAPVTE